MTKLGRSLGSNWLAIDDMPRFFQRDCPWLLITDSKQGFDQKSWALLNAWLETGTLPAEVPSTGQIMMRHTDLVPRCVAFDYALYARSCRLVVSVPYLDSFLLTQFLIEMTDRGVQGLWGENVGWRNPEESRWSIEVLIGTSLLTVKAYALTPQLGGQNNLAHRARFLKRCSRHHTTALRSLSPLLSRQGVRQAVTTSR